MYHLRIIHYMEEACLVGALISPMARTRVHRVVGQVYLGSILVCYEHQFRRTTDVLDKFSWVPIWAMNML